MNFLIMAGHTLDGQKGSGAVGYIHESVETRRVGPAVTENLRKLGQKATYIKLDKPITNSYLYDQVKLANSKGKFDCVVQIHFNAGSKDKDDKQAGTETYYRSSNGKVFAVRVNNKLNELYSKRDTGARNDKPNLYWLKNTNCPAILIEVCFVDDKDDVKVYNDNFDKTCRLIAEGLANKTIKEDKGGWVKFEKGWSYKKSGEWLYGWQEIDNKWYRFNEHGYALTGWQKVYDKWYFFNEDCSMKTGWLKDKDKWYYLKEDGSMATGWIEIKGKKYYLHKNGVMENKHIDLEGKCYHFTDSGELIKTTNI